MFERLEKMDRRTLAAIGIAVVIAMVAGLLLFGAIAGGIRQAGWNEGFLVGQLAGGVQPSTESGQAAVNPYLAARGFGAHGWGGHGWGWHPFWIIGGFFRFLFFGFLIMLLLKFIAFRRWAHHGGYGRGPWSHHGRHHWGQHGGPWQPGYGDQPPNAPSPQAPTESSAASGADPMPGDAQQAQQTSWTHV